MFDSDEMFNDIEDLECFIKRDFRQVIVEDVKDIYVVLTIEVGLVDTVVGEELADDGEISHFVLVEIYYLFWFDVFFVHRDKKVEEAICE
jgi:hypothetical protein